MGNGTGRDGTGEDGTGEVGMGEDGTDGKGIPRVLYCYCVCGTVSQFSESFDQMDINEHQMHIH